MSRPTAWSRVQPGFTDLITAIFFLSGCVLASVGILGRYMIMILEQVRGRPAYVVMDHVPGTPLSPASSTISTKLGPKQLMPA